MDEVALTPEQDYLLARVRYEAQDMEREALITALCDAWEARFRLKQSFICLSRQAGFVFLLEERRPWQPPKSDAEFARLLGYIPSPQERAAYLKHQREAVTMELDMEAIVLTPDEDD